MEKETVSIPFVAYESSMNRMERVNKRTTIIALCELGIILLMFVSIMIYFYLPSEEIDTSTQTVSEIEDGNINQNIGE